MIVSVRDDRFLLRGFIDRVDRAPRTALAYIDYKTAGPERLLQAAVTEGKRLQLPLYALAARDALGVGRPGRSASTGMSSTPSPAVSRWRDSTAVPKERWRRRLPWRGRQCAARGMDSSFHSPVRWLPGLLPGRGFLLALPTRYGGERAMSREPRSHPIVNQLAPSAEQRPAVDARDRDVVVTAGAGTGKTRTLVARYLSLLAEGRSAAALHRGHHLHPQGRARDAQPRARGDPSLPGEAGSGRREAAAAGRTATPSWTPPASAPSTACAPRSCAPTPPRPASTRASRSWTRARRPCFAPRPWRHAMAWAAEDPRPRRCSACWASARCARRSTP